MIGAHHQARFNPHLEKIQNLNQIWNFKTTTIFLMVARLLQIKTNQCTKKLAEFLLVRCYIDFKRVIATHFVRSTWWVGFSKKHRLKCNWFDFLGDAQFYLMVLQTKSRWIFSAFLIRNVYFLIVIMRMQIVLHWRYLCLQQQINESEREGAWPQRTILTFNSYLYRLLYSGLYFLHKCSFHS